MSFTEADADALQLLFGKMDAGAQREHWRRTGIVGFSREVLGIRLCRGQRDGARLIDAINNAGLPANREVSIKTGHGVGKTHLGAVTVCWWLAAWGPGTVVITSAPTNRQVEELLWREINTIWARNETLCALGRPLQREIKIMPDWVAYGFSTREPERFQGWHAPVLRFLIDEANGFPEPIWTAIDACLTGENSQLVLLGNPIVSLGRFYRTFADPAVATLSISSRDHPNVKASRQLIPGAVTREWIEHFEGQYRTSPEIVGSRIDALFPEVGSPRAIVPLAGLRRAREVEAKTLEPIVYGLDVSRYGDALTVLTRISGQRVEPQIEWSKRSITYTVERTREEWEKAGADMIVVDDVGLGGGVTDGLRALGLPVVAFNGGEPANDPTRFANKNAEAWWAVRELTEQDVLSLAFPENELDVQFGSREYMVQSDRRIRLESKEDYTRRTGLPSPDHADSLAMAVWGLVSVWSEWATGRARERAATGA